MPHPPADRSNFRGAILRAWGVLALLLLVTGPVRAADQQPMQLFVVEPYLDLRTGPAEGYPVTQVVVRGEAVSLIVQRGEFVKVRTERQIEGWARASDLNRARLAEGGSPGLPERTADGFPSRRWEAGALAGEMQDARIAAAYVAARIAGGLQAEISGSNMLGNSRSLYVLDAGLTYAFLRGSRLEPFVMAGYGVAQVSRGLPPTGSSERDSDRTAYAGVGLRTPLSGPLFVRLDLRRRFLYSSDAETEEINEWRIGISFFP